MEERNTACARLYHLIFGKNKLVIIAITLEEQVNKSREIGLHDQNRPYQIKKTIERTVLEYRRKRAVDGRIHANFLISKDQLLTFQTNFFNNTIFSNF